MIIDFERLEAGTAFEADICVIGSGPAGLAVAREFFGTATTVIVLESGGLAFEAASEALNDGHGIGLPYSGLRAGRRRQFSGAANIWGHVCVELEASDFGDRTWIAGSGWPLGAGDLAPYYDRARALFGLGSTDYGADGWREYGMTAAAFDARAVRYSIVPTTPFLDLGKTYRGDFRTAPNVRVVLHSTVTSLETNAAGTAMEHAVFRSLGGARGTVKARTFVLCCGGIENARLLLMSRNAHRTGLGNGRDLVGRYLADHLRSMTAAIAPRHRRRLHRAFRCVRRRGVTLRPRFSLPPAQQERAGVLNCMAQVHFDHPADGGFSAALSLRKAIRYRRMPEHFGRDVRNVLCHPRELAAMAVDRYVRGLHPAPDHALLRLECWAEQVPNPQSRVTLGDRRDRFGLPLPTVDWRADDMERRTMAFMTHLVAHEFERLGLGTIEPEAWLNDGASRAWQNHVVEAFHPLGTTRMAASPQQGVVDADCGVHGVRGLYVTGTSVFPAAGYANPTLTIVALAIRLADHLKANRSRLPNAIAPARTAPAR